MLARLIATGFYTGYAPKAPGTFGTLPGIALAFLLADVAVVSLPLYLLLVGLCVGVAIWSADVYSASLGVKDPSSVVSDEMVGYVFAVAFIPVTVAHWLAAFLLFRVFDIVKPPPARQAEGFSGGTGIVADDLVAGIYANLALRLAMHLGFL